MSSGPERRAGVHVTYVAHVAHVARAANCDCWLRVTCAASTVERFYRGL